MATLVPILVLAIMSDGFVALDEWAAFWSEDIGTIAVGVANVGIVAGALANMVKNTSTVHAGRLARTPLFWGAWAMVVTSACVVAPWKLRVAYAMQNVFLFQTLGSLDAVTRRPARWQVVVLTLLLTMRIVTGVVLDLTLPELDEVVIFTVGTAMYTRAAIRRVLAFQLTSLLAMSFKSILSDRLDLRYIFVTQATFRPGRASRMSIYAVTNASIITRSISKKRRASRAPAARRDLTPLHVSPHGGSALAGSDSSSGSGGTAGAPQAFPRWWRAMDTAATVIALLFVALYVLRSFLGVAVPDALIWVVFAVEVVATCLLVVGNVNRTSLARLAGLPDVWFVVANTVIGTLAGANVEDTFNIHFVLANCLTTLFFVCQDALKRPPQRTQAAAAFLFAGVSAWGLTRVLLRDGARGQETLLALGKFRLSSVTAFRAMRSATLMLTARSAVVALRQVRVPEGGRLQYMFFRRRALRDPLRDEVHPRGSLATTLPGSLVLAATGASPQHRQSLVARVLAMSASTSSGAAVAVHPSPPGSAECPSHFETATYTAATDAPPQDET